MTAAIYEIDGLQKAYGGRTVLALESLDIREGERLALVGPSGAGKSTLLRLLNFLEAPSQGGLRYRGETIANGGARLELRRQVTTVFQRPVLLDADVAVNVRYGMRLRGQRSEARVRALLERVGLAPLPALRRTLSAGEMQRVAGSGAAGGAQRAAADEPTANLDPYNVGLIETSFASMASATARPSCW
jgi:tungstate transport system ATP-binding protein